MPDQGSALAELRRVIRPGGELRFYEHVAATDPRWAQWQRRVDPDPTGRWRGLSRALDHDSSRPVRVGEVSTIGHDGLPTAPPVG